MTIIGNLQFSCVNICQFYANYLLESADLICVIGIGGEPKKEKSDCKNTTAFNVDPEGHDPTTFGL